MHQESFEFDTQQLPDIGIFWKEFKPMPLSTTVHTALEFINIHKTKRPIMFQNDFWYFKEIIDTQINNIEQIKKNDMLIISVPFFETFQYKTNMNDILKKCCELDVPVLIGSVLTISIVFIMINIFVDIIYTWLDPRIKIKN